MKNVIWSLKICFTVVLMCAAAFFFYIIETLFISSNAAYTNPLVSGFLHEGIDHIYYNILILFIAMLNPINQKYNWKSIYIITTIISLIYLPITLIGITGTAIGLSGTCSFFLSRAFIKWGIITRIIILIITISEFYNLSNSDGTAHGVHLIGLILGAVSYIIEKTKKPRNNSGLFLNLYSI